MSILVYLCIFNHILMYICKYIYFYVCVYILTYINWDTPAGNLAIHSFLKSDAGVQNEKDILSTILRQAGETVHEPNRSAFTVYRFHHEYSGLSLSVSFLVFVFRVSGVGFLVWSEGCRV